jgi:transketolase
MTQQVVLENLAASDWLPSDQTTQLPLVEEAQNVRREVVQALHACGAGHYGGSLSVVDILLTLYRQHLTLLPSEPLHPQRDRLILSKGHAAMTLYAVLRRLGYFEESLERYASLGSILEGHPDMRCTPGVDFSTGSLGQGLSVGAGMALALRNQRPRVWVVLGDGECQEGQVWEAALVAAEYQLDRLHAVVDANGFQEWGWRRGSVGAGRPLPVPDLAAKWRAFGWHVEECDGHDHVQLNRAFKVMQGTRSRPSVLIARTIKGRGFPLLEANPHRFHCGELSDTEFRAVMEA